MSVVKIPAWYYRQYNADYSLAVPAEGYGGWDKTDLDFDMGSSAIAVMHACNCGSIEEVPGWYRVVEYLPRANQISKDVFPRLLDAVRRSSMKVIHIAFPGEYYKNLPGYKKTLELCVNGNAQCEKMPYDPVVDSLLKFKTESVFPGKTNIADIANGSKKLNFYTETMPLDTEEIVENEEQLFTLCKKYCINHLVYTGFAVDGCLLVSSGGMLDMSRKGILCSVIRQAVTAIENKETARAEICKGIALWRVALLFGFVYDLEDFIGGINGV